MLTAAGLFVLVMTSPLAPAPPAAVSPVHVWADFLQVDVRQALPQTPTTALPSPHRFFDGTNLALTIAESGALLADGITTQYGIKHYGGREGDPLAAPFVNAGWPGQIAGGMLVVAGDLGLRYFFHQHGHHRLERWVPLLLTTYEVTETIHNLTVISSSPRQRE